MSPPVPGPRVVVLGVAGSGKSTVGALLAEALGVPFADADDLHGPEAVAAMAAGVPLTDADRGPWLDRVGRRVAASSGLVMACSALRRSYRDRIRSHAPGVVLVHLTVDPEILARRLADRTGHFMGAEMLPGQLETLEPLAPDELGVPVAADAAPDRVAAAARAALAHLGGGRR